MQTRLIIVAVIVISMAFAAIAANRGTATTSHVAVSEAATIQDFTGVWNWTDTTSVGGQYSGIATIDAFQSGVDFGWADQFATGWGAPICYAGDGCPAPPSINGDSIVIPGYTNDRSLSATWSGTIAASGDTITGTWTQSDGQFGTFVATKIADGLVFRSDGDWKFSRPVTTGWEQPAYDDGAWGNTVGDFAGLCGGPYPGQMWAPNPVNGETIFVRRTIDLATAPTHAIYAGGFDDDGLVFVNGALVHTDDDNWSTGIRTVDITTHLHTGSNVLAMQASDDVGGCQSIYARFAIAGATTPPTPTPTPTATATPTPARYVALGDSIPYGHGLSDPRPSTTFPLGQGPSADAYPSLIATRLEYRLSLRHTGCTLVADQLAVSGAPSSSANVTGNDDDCPNAFRRNGKPYSTLPHKAVYPDELSAANLSADPPTLVTIQVGANDIDFGACVTAILVALFPSCTQHGPNNTLLVTDSIRSRLDTLTSSLAVIVTRIENAAPGVRVVVVNYYQPAPTPTEQLINDRSFICRDLYTANRRQRIDMYNEAAVLLQALNNAIAAVKTIRPEITIADVSHSFDGHELCTASTANNYMFTDRWRAVHPTADGHKALADAIAKAIRGP